MGLAVVTVAAGGLPVVESTIGGAPVTEATNGYGVPVTKVTGGKPGLPVVFETIGVGPGVTYATLNGVNSAQVTLSNGNLTATLGSFASSVGARSTTLKSTGKYYFEVTVGPTNGNGNCIGILSSAGTYANMNSGQNCVIVFSNGDIYASNAWAGKTLPVFVTADVFCFAMDLTARKGWIRKGAGNWNNDGTHNPATGAGGVTIAATVDFSPAAMFGGGAQQVGNAFTSNFGATAFTQAVPAGFTSGWPA